MNPVRLVRKTGSGLLVLIQPLLLSLVWASSEGASPFYQWNADVPAEPGKLLRQEPLEAGLLLENASGGTRILYTSRGFSGEPVAVSGTKTAPDQMSHPRPPA